MARPRPLSEFRLLPATLLLPLLLTLLLPPALPAQGDPEVPPAAELRARFDAAQRARNEALRAASKAGDTERLAELRRARPRDAFVPAFEAGALAHAGTEAAVPYLVWLVQRAPAARSQAAMATLMDRHVGSSGIRLAVARIGGLKRQYGEERSIGWLDRVIAENGDPHVLAQARYTRAAMFVGTRAIRRSADLREQAIHDLRAALELLGDDAAGASLRGLASRLLDEAERLEPGQIAPEISGEDLDGVPFKLSDYRGKVVLLDFWGDW